MEKAVQDSIYAANNSVIVDSNSANIDSLGVYQPEPDSLQISESPSESEGIPEGRERTLGNKNPDLIKEPADTTKKREFLEK